VFALGLLFAPRMPSARRVNPDQLLSIVLNGYRPMVRHIRRDGRVVAEFSAKPSSRLVLKNYTPLVEGEETIAGRDAWLLRLKPKVKYRPWRQLWIDKKSYSILAIRDWSHRNEIRRSVRLEKPPAALGSLVFLSATRTIHPGSALRGLKRPRFIPEGFELIDDGSWDGLSDLRALIYTDGLFNVSLFYRFSGRQGREQKQRLSVCDCGETLAVTAMLDSGCVTVVADLPEKDLLRIARSIR
jgi:hypothetical protein